MKRLLPAALLLALAMHAWGADVKLPAEVNAKPGRLTQLTAETTGKLVRWKCASEEADVIAIRDDGRKAIFSSPTPGRYVVLAWTAEGDVPSEAAQCVVIVGDAPPVPPGPGPGPGPIPPGPTDPLTKTLQAAYDADTTAGKAAHLASLAALYRNAGPTCQRGDLKTAGDLYGVLKAAAVALLPADALPKLRRAVGDELNKALPTDPAAALDQAARDKAAGEFAKLATALGGIR